MRYAVSQTVRPTIGDQQGYFEFIAGDGTQVRITKDTINQWIIEGGIENAKSQIFATLNLTFSIYQNEGYSYVEIAPDGEPIDFVQSTEPME